MFNMGKIEQYVRKYDECAYIYPVIKEDISGIEDKQWIILADWSKPELSALEDKLDHSFYRDKGLYAEYYDQWYVCDDCGHACRKINYTRDPNYIWLPDGLACRECIETGGYDEDVLDLYVNDPGKAIFWWLLEHLEKNYHFTVVEEGETGMYPGQNDNPDKILNKVMKENPGAHYIFHITESNPFATYWRLLSIFKRISGGL